MICSTVQPTEIGTKCSNLCTTFLQQNIHLSFAIGISISIGIGSELLLRMDWSVMRCILYTAQCTGAGKEEGVRSC